ncbi:MerR HTH family regulatory protein, partial [Pseudovibrio denitrificans]
MTGKSDTYSRTYTASEVAKIVGMNIETLRVWRRRK